MREPIEATRALLDRGFPEALTVDPEALEALRRSDRRDRTRLRRWVFALLLFAAVLIAAYQAVAYVGDRFGSIGG